MQFQRTLSWLFALYLILLLNLGPGLHRAGLFGFHAHRDASATSSDASTTDHSGCGCRHGMPPVEPDSELPSGQLVTDVSDCAFCKFFAQYRLTFTVSYYQALEVESDFHFFDLTQEYLLTPFVPHARGPPALVG